MTCHIVAEIGCNYPQAFISDAKQMIINSKEAGADFVKFQLFNEDVIKDSPIKERLASYILKEEDVVEFRKEADRVKIGFVLTPMYLEAVDIANKYADMIKIRFKDNENKSLIDKVLDTGKPMLISVPKPPMDIMLAYNPRVFPMYCLPSYPPVPEDFNLDQCSVCKGFSSHFPHTLFDLGFAFNHIYPEVYIEKHVMLDFDLKDGIGYTCSGRRTADHDYEAPIDWAVSLEFNELKTFIKQVQLIERIKRTRI
jgi:sialic acid synthase SpsE